MLIEEQEEDPALCLYTTQSRWHALTDIMIFYNIKELCTKTDLRFSTDLSIVPVEYELKSQR